jgi:putative oxidoreductase
MSNSELPVALFILRLGLGVFLLLFGIDKLVAPETTVEVFAQFYGLIVSHGMVYGAGALEILLGLAFLVGLWKTLSYGLGLLLHAVSTLATYHELLSPFGTNHLFLAAVPVLAAFIALFQLRRHDTLWSAGKAAG